MFDNSKPNIILISDLTEPVFFSKSFGVFKIARELRLSGYQVAVLHHIHIFEFEEILYILDKLISNKTLFVGINNMFYRNVFTEVENKHYKGGIQWGDCPDGTMLPHGKHLNKQLKDFIKSKNHNCKLVLGGSTANDIEANKDFDYVVAGYADISVVNLANHLYKQEELKKFYKSIYGFTLLNDSTAADYDFVHRKMAYETHDGILPNETLPIEISRGCIFKCAFCAFPLNGKRKNDYIKDFDVLYEEFLDNYAKFGTTRYIFLDDTFNDTVDKVKFIHEISKKLPFKLEYWAYLRLDLLAAHPETINLLLQSGLRSCYFGVETFNKKTGQTIGKGLAKDKMLDTLRMLKKVWNTKVSTAVGFIAGLPHESIESIKNTCEIFLSEDLVSSWVIRPLYFYSNRASTTGFVSEIEKNPAKYGYKNLTPFNPEMHPGEIHYNTHYWENDYTNFNECNELCKYYNKQYELTGMKKLSDMAILQLASYGIDITDYNKAISEINWHEIVLLKQQRSNEYKELIYNEFNIPKFINKY